MKEKIKERIKRLAEETAKAGADAFAVINDESSNWQNLYYLSGFRGTSGALLVRASGEAELLLDGRYIEQGREQSPLPVRPLENNLTQDVTALVKKIGAKEILCEAYATAHKIWTSLESGGGIWRDGASITETMRRTKDEKETALIKKAAEIGAKAFLETLGAAKAGMTEKAFAALLDYNITIAGGEPGFEMIVASGPRSVMPHGRASEREMRSGEWVTVDFGARAGGYFCDITRNFCIGGTSAEAEEMHELLKKAHKEAAEMLRPGINGKEVHGRAVEILEEAGVAQYFTHSLGHGFGLDIHEAPLLSGRRDDILKAGDIVTIEPGLYIPDFGGMRLEDDYLITETGAERLTKELNQTFYRV